MLYFKFVLWPLFISLFRSYENCGSAEKVSNWQSSLLVGAVILLFRYYRISGNFGVRKVWRILAKSSS